MLENILVRTHKLTERVAKEAAADFKKSAEYAEVMVNGVINSTRETQSSATKPELDEQLKDDLEKDDQVVKGAPKAPTSYLTVVIPNSDVRILFPPEYSYELSIGAFGAAIKSLDQAVNKVHVEVPTDEQSDTPTEE